MNITLSQDPHVSMNKVTIQETLKLIPTLQRQVFLLRTFHEYSTKQMCTAFEIEEKRFWSYIHETRKFLIQSLN